MVKVLRKIRVLKSNRMMNEKRKEHFENRQKIIIQIYVVFMT